jgi:hypothetical protein
MARLVVFLAAVIALRGLNTVAPGEARGVQLFWLCRLFGRRRVAIRQDDLRE